MAARVVVLRRTVVAAGSNPAGAIFRRRLCVAPQRRRPLQEQEDTTRQSRREAAPGPTPESVAEGSPTAAARELPVVKGDDCSVQVGGKTGGASAATAAAPVDAVRVAAGQAPGAPPVGGRAAGGGAAEGEDKAAASSTTGDEDELWIVGRVLQRFDDRLGAKQDRIREAELGVIDRYASLISTLDSSLEAREDDEFLTWLDSSKISPASAVSTDSAPSEGIGDGGNGSAAGSDGRYRVEQFISDAGARLDALVAHKQDMLFRDRDLRIGKNGDNETTVAAEAGTGTGTGAQVGGAATAATALPEDELYQIHVTAHRTMLSKCLSLVSESLGKQHLKPGLSVKEVAAATRSAYLAGPEDRLGALFPLFDAHGDGYLDPESVERVVDTVILPVTATAERLYAAAARAALDKKAAGAMPKTMKYTLWDVLEVPVKRRCAFAWAEERKQVGPDEWRISWEQFKPSRRVNFPELESLASNYLAEYRRRRSAWHNTRKGRKRAAIYGTALFTTVVFLDNFLATV